MFFFRGILFGIVFGVPAGAIGALTIQRSLEKGFSFGLATGLGSSFADLIYAILSAFAFGTFSSIILRWQTPMRIFGGALILLMGVSVLLKKANVPSGKDAQGDLASRSKVLGLLFCFASSFLVAIANPAAILSFAAAFSSLDLVLLKEGANAALLVMGIFTGTVIWWLLLTGGVSIFRKKITDKIYGILNKVLGSLLCLLGVVVVVGVFTSFSSPKKVSNIDSSEITSFETTKITLSENPVELDKGLRAVSSSGDPTDVQSGNHPVKNLTTGIIEMTSQTTPTPSMKNR